MKHSGVIGHDDFAKELEEIVVQMKKGEKWIVEGT